MLLPDTIEFGKKFKDNMIKHYQTYLKNTNLQILGLINPSIRPTMDMGIFNIEHLKNISEYFSKIKTYDLSKSNLLKLKIRLISDEDTIFGSPSRNDGTNFRSIVKDKIFLCNNKKDFIEKRINNKINRVYFPLLDLYKFQRNFRGFGNITLNYNN